MGFIYIMFISSLTIVNSKNYDPQSLPSSRGVRPRDKVDTLFL